MSGRASPTPHASKTSLGVRRRGGDGLVYIVTATIAGQRRWVLTEESKAAKKAMTLCRTFVLKPVAAMYEHSNATESRRATPSAKRTNGRGPDFSSAKATGIVWESVSGLHLIATTEAGSRQPVSYAKSVKWQAARQVYEVQVCCLDDARIAGIVASSMEELYGNQSADTWTEGDMSIDRRFYMQELILIKQAQAQAKAKAPAKAKAKAPAKKKPSSYIALWDNYEVPFYVYFDRWAAQPASETSPGAVEVYKARAPANEDDDEYEEEDAETQRARYTHLVCAWPRTHLLLGKAQKPKWDGNTVIVIHPASASASAAYAYTYVGGEAYAFSAPGGAAVTEFFSHGDVADSVPYPVAFTATHALFMLDRVAVPLSAVPEKLLRKEESRGDLYGWFYKHGKGVSVALRTKTIAKP